MKLYNKSWKRLLTFVCLSVGIISHATAETCTTPLEFKKQIPMNWEYSKSTHENKNNSITLVNLWAVWCPPCIKELPMLDQLNKHSHINVETIHLGGNSEKVTPRFIKLNIETLPEYSEPDYSLLDRWLFNALPATLIVIDGKVRYRRQGLITSTEEQLSTWMNCLNAEES
ncbi:TlpA family protein disulfide reductase [Vibrio sp. SS-MA-C1-2]|uniref:TlpA family protein disulfide reductase n=1 Tax=Vibrio sp. SS-MA-C1-2 TaxID=2908646 RepID=UPI001F1E59E5|nr:TlpA disulfide reductase family protein [Vibrio sp. SS-MA-C1-2]UJF18447.1 TlpA family protein disulfide reductase [Vibrio sp. SS-MA-C1-2]